MTKWARMRRRKERKKAEEALRRAEADGKEIEKIEYTKTSSPNTILSQIPRYAYLLAFFVLLAGIFVPLITYQTSFDTVIHGTATLFLGLAGAILLFKAATSDKRRGIFIAIGFALIAISLALIFMLQEHARLY